MDLTINLQDYKLNIRATAIIIHDNKLLTHKNINSEYYALPGGRVQLGESSEETIKREIFEETGKEIEITGYVSTTENFFKGENAKYHELMFIYRAEFKKEQDKHIISTIKNIEGEVELQYEWIDLNKIEEYDIRPKSIKETLKEENLPIHKINYDMK